MACEMVLKWLDFNFLLGSIKWVVAAQLSNFKMIDDSIEQIKKRKNPQLMLIKIVEAPAINQARMALNCPHPPL